MAAKTADAEDNYIQMPLGRMLDVAINSAEGTVNFFLLHAVLHTLIEKSAASGVAVELHGHEVKKLGQQLKDEPAQPSFMVKQTTESDQAGREQQVFVMKPDTQYTGTSSVTKEKVDGLAQELVDVKKQLAELRDLPANLGIINAVKNEDIAKSGVVDVLHLMTIQKRIEAAEEGMVKLAEIVEDLIKSPGDGPGPGPAPGPGAPLKASPSQRKPQVSVLKPALPSASQVFVQSKDQKIKINDDVVVGPDNKPLEPGTIVTDPDGGNPMVVGPDRKPIPINVVPPEGMVVIDESQLKKTPSGTWLSAQNEPLAPGTIVSTAQGRSVIDGQGKPVLVTPDGKASKAKLLSANQCTLKDGVAVGLDGKKLAPGTMFEGPNGAPYVVSPKGTAVPVSLPQTGPVLAQNQYQVGQGGVLSTPDGKPLPPGTVVTSADGNVVVVGPQGILTPLNASTPGVSAPVTLPPGETRLEIPFVPSGTLQQGQTVGNISPSASKTIQDKASAPTQAKIPAAPSTQKVQKSLQTFPTASSFPLTEKKSDVKSRAPTATTLEGKVDYLLKEMDQMQRILGPNAESAGLPYTEMAGIVMDIRSKFRPRSESDADGTDQGLEELSPQIQLIVMEERFRDTSAHLVKLDLLFNDEISKLHNQFTDIEKDFNELLTRIELGLPGGDSNEPNACCAAVFQKIISLQNDFDALANTSLTLMDDREQKTKLMDVMLEQIEVLKTVKADREDVEEALADKADACAIMRKVSHDQFDNACEELSKGIEDALEKLTQQESLWQQALDDIQSEIGHKLDKMDLGPLREFINSKLRALQDKMRSLAALKRDQEAAGTKSKFLRDVNCISCDKDVVMRKEMDLTMRPKGKVLPPSRSMGPYLAYELDALRKQQKQMPGGKNLLNLESALGMKGKRADDHICNRYCGGSHTVTTPQQRVTRLGHFLMQWGPEAQPSLDSKKVDAVAEEAIETATQPSSKLLPKKQVSGGSKSKLSSKTPSITSAERKLQESKKKGSSEEVKKPTAGPKKESPKSSRRSITSTKGQQPKAVEAIAEEVVTEEAAAEEEEEGEGNGPAMPPGRSEFVTPLEEEEENEADDAAPEEVQNAPEDD